MNVKIVSRLSLLGLLAVLGACSPSELPPETSEATLRQLTGGAVIGFENEAGAQSWLGLSYAASTAGENRWRAPQAVTSWEGRFEALEHSAPCPQIINTLSSEATGRPVGELYGSEDCLKLDVYAPAGAGPDTPDRPVMMWIHGGSNTWGYASHYDGAQLAQDRNVVVVVIQYRLGPLGFFAHPTLDDSVGANFALLDHVAALNWIEREIAQFGGDASSVTIFGESAGGQNVAALMASPLSEGLFHRAIIQSGLFDSVPLEEAQSGGEQSAIPAAGRMVEGGVNADALRAVSLDQVFGAYDLGASRGSLPRVIADGVTLPSSGLAGAFQSGEYQAVPVITGTNRDEMKLFNAFDPALTTRRFSVLISPRDPGFYDRLSRYQSRLWRIQSVDQPVGWMSEAGQDTVWAYRFDWDEAGSLLTTDFADIFGAAHAMEIPFVFNNFDFFGKIDPFLFHGRNEEGREALAQSMGAYWAAFAHTGDPGAAGGPDWPSASAQPVLMRFDAGGAELMEGRDTIEALLSDLASDESLTPEQTCAIGAALVDWSPGLADEVAGALAC
ncbi:carboxylesterase/lipase family protein [Oceanicaulis sp. LC35]|uniref:carboxylesterase/lipase family protein n=1 Tax=Oceanicaulis sp. LC35 TaxID=3349635 RepID=UPI003F833BA1